MLQNPVRLLMGLPGTVRLLVAGTLVNKLGTFILPYLAIVLQRHFSLSAAHVGALMTAYGVGSIVSILIGGYLTDRLGRRQTLMVSMFGSGLLAVAMGLAPSVRVFVPLLVAFGFLADLYRPAASAIIGDTLPSAQRALGFASLRLAVNLGFAFGLALGGLLADWDWRLLFFGDGVTTLLYGVVVYFYIPETHPDLAAAAPAATRTATTSPWRDGVYLETALASLMFAVMFFIHMTALPLTITVSAGYPARVYGFLVGVNGLLIALFELPLVDWLKRFRRLRVAALGLVIAGVGFALTGLHLHWAWFLFTVVLWTAGEILCAPQSMAFVADWAPRESRGRYLGMIQATWSVALSINPPLFLPLHARLPERLFWPLMLLLALPGAVLLLHLDRTADEPGRLRGLDAEPPSQEELLVAAFPEA